MHNKYKGNTGELKVAAHLASLGYSVFTELGDISKVDLILEKDNVLYRIQVKSITSKNGMVLLDSRKFGPNYSYRYNTNDVDIFAIYALEEEIIGFISSEEFLSQSHMSFRIIPPRNKQIKKIRMLSDYIDIHKVLNQIDSGSLNLKP